MFRSLLVLLVVVGGSAGASAAERQLGPASYASRLNHRPQYSTAAQLARAASGTTYQRRFGPYSPAGYAAVTANEARTDSILSRSHAYRANIWPWYAQPVRWNYYYYRPFYPAYWNSYYWYGVYPQGYYYGPGFWGSPYWGAGPLGWPGYFPGYVGTYGYGGFPITPCAGGGCVTVEYGGYYW
ncbi:MAG: hypothetical protein U0836_12395 [Pirellulales bacterium]